MSEAMVNPTGGEAAEDCVVEDVLDEHRLPDSVRSDEDDVGGVTDEFCGLVGAYSPTRTGEGEEFLDDSAGRSMRLGQVQSKSATGLKAPMRVEGVGQASFEGAALAFAVFDVDDAFDPRFAEHGVVLDGETVECDGAQALSHGVGFSRWSLVHCRRLGVHRRIRRRGEGRSRRGRGAGRTDRERSRGSSGRASASGGGLSASCRCWSMKWRTPPRCAASD